MRSRFTLKTAIKMVLCDSFNEPHESAEVKDIMIIDADLLFTADAVDVVTAEFHLTRRVKVVVERTFMTLYTVVQTMHFLILNKNQRHICSSTYTACKCSSQV